MPPLPFKRVLVPTDLGPVSGRALEQALLLVRDPSHLHTLHVVPWLLKTAWTRAGGSVEDQVRGQMERWLDSFGVPVANRHLAYGRPGDTVGEVAGRLGATLVVLPAHREGVLERAFLGSTAERVIARSPCDVLVIPPTGSPPLRVGRVGTVLVGWDRSPGARRALRLARRLANGDGALVVAHVLSELAEPLEGLWPAGAGQELLRASEADLVRDLAHVGLDEARVVVRGGSPGTELPALAKGEGAELVAIGARGEAEDGLGRVAARVLRRCTCSVLVARPLPRSGLG